MIIQTRKIQVRPDTHAIDVEVTSPVPNKIAVSNGTVKFEKTEYQFKADEFTVEPDAAHEKLIDAYLVEHNRNCVLFVDELVMDGIDERFNFAESPYTVLHDLVSITLPPNANLDSATALVTTFEEINYADSSETTSGTSGETSTGA